MQLKNYNFYYKKYFWKKKILNYLYYFYIKNKKKQLYIYNILKFIPKRASICMQKRYCIESNKIKSVYRKFRLTRHAFNYYYSKGLIKGCKKSA